MRRLPPLVLALVLGVATALAVSACGGGDDDDRKLLSPTKASEIRDELDKIAERVDRGECVELQPAFVRLNRAIDELPKTVDRGLRRRLAQGTRNLEQIAPEECRESRPKTTETTDTAPETTETAPATTETVPPTTTTEPPPTTTQAPPPQTTPPQTTPPQETVPPDNGGSEAPPANFSPPGQTKKGGKDE